LISQQTFHFRIPSSSSSRRWRRDEDEEGILKRTVGWLIKHRPTDQGSAEAKGFFHNL
jgi:hypothetical protein